MDLGKPFRKKPIQKNRNNKNQSEIAACEQKQIKQISVQTPFSHSTLKLELKNHATKPLAFSLYFLFRRDQHHHQLKSNLCSQTNLRITALSRRSKKKPFTKSLT